MTQDQKTLDFIKSAELVHGVGTYDYSKSVYVNSKTKLEIRCPKHDSVFLQTPGHHVNKKCRCPKCGRESGNSKQTKTTEDFIKDAKALHGNTYNYDKSSYVNKYTNLIITCPIHGEFEQTPCNHKKSVFGCPDCVKENNSIIELTKEDFIKRAKEVHGDLYSYDKVEFNGVCEKVTITCKKHGDFSQVVYGHLRGQGCPNCCISKGEAAIKKFLDDKNIKYEQQKSFSECLYKGKLKFDFYLPDHNTVIEFQGRQHFEAVSYFGGEEGFKLTQERDKVKKDYCATNGITMLELTEPAELAIFKALSIYVRSTF